MAQATERNWTVATIFEARGENLRTPAGELVRANLDAWGCWYVMTIAQNFDTRDAETTAAVLNHLQAA